MARTPSTLVALVILLLSSAGADCGALRTPPLSVLVPQVWTCQWRPIRLRWPWTAQEAAQNSHSPRWCPVAGGFCSRRTRWAAAACVATWPIMSLLLRCQQHVWQPCCYPAAGHVRPDGLAPPPVVPLEHMGIRVAGTLACARGGIDEEGRALAA
mmetsp:Transcript_32530/g.89751  ORF Transcript_32530/g.89751 Transcript_32530/m.89751 type:complete len:155 (-) Transcript_32530:3-467(-)